MVKKIEYSNTNEFSCELCDEKFGNNFGLAENHEIHECKVGHEVRMAFWRGEIESPLSGKKKIDKSNKLKNGLKKEFSNLKGEIDKARKSFSPRLLNDISEEKIKKIEEAIENDELNDAQELIGNISKEIKNIIVISNPKLMASIPNKLQANVWIRSTITINNEGDAHACDIELSIDGLEVRGSPRIDFLEAGNTKEIDIALRTDGAGSIPVTISLEFEKMYDNSPLSAEFSEWIEAGGVVPMASSTETTLPKTKTSTKTSAPVEEWKPPEGLDGDLEILAEFFALRRNAYQASPANESLLDELHNRREDFAISSYFEIPTSSADILQEWALPPNIRGNVHLDTIREDIVERVSSAEAKQNFVIIGDPGVGKTVLLFEVMDRLMKKMPVGVITTPALGDAHLTFGTRLFYDDIPENMDLIDAINERQSQGLVVTAREADWQALPESFQSLFDRLTVPLFTKEDMVPLCNKMLEFSGLGYDKSAVKLLVDFAEGSPIYVWSLIRELMHSGIRTLSKTYIQEHATKGMANYVSMLLQRLLKDGKEFRPGGLHALTCMVFLTEYMDERRCHDLYFRTAAEVIAERTEEELNDSLHMVTFNHVMAYLSGEGAIVRFPHDTWVDVLGGAGSLNPFRAEIQTIHSAFEDTGAFNEVMKETVVDTWTTLSSRYRRNSARNRDSFLALADTLLRNFTLADLKELEVDIELMREVASAHSHLPLAAMLVSKLQTAQPSQAANVINIQDSVINRSNLT